MKLFNSRYGYSLIVALLLFTSCKKDKFFELERPPQFPWKNITEFEFAAASPYHKFFYGSNGGGWETPYGGMLTLSAYLSDYFKWYDNPEGYPTDQVYNRRFNERVDQVELRFREMYEMIGLCNNGLDFFAKTNNDPYPTASPDDRQKNIMRIKGELHFNRALAYFSLVNLFCPPYGSGQNDKAILPLRTRVATSAQDALDNAPVPTSQIYDQIVADLKEAKSLLPEVWDAKMHPSYKSEGRANKFAASALLSKVYLSMEKLTGNESALSELNVVLNSTSQNYGLEDDPFAVFTNTDRYPDSREVVMWAFYADPVWATNNHSAFRMMMFNKSARNAVNGGRGMNADWSLVSYFQLGMANSALKEIGWANEDMSESDAAKLDKRYKKLFYRFEGYKAAGPTDKNRSGATDDGLYITYEKYKSAGPMVLVDKYYRAPLGRMQNIPFIRVSDLLLTRAMIHALNGNEAEADADYNKVAVRAWDAAAAGVAYTPKVGVTTNDILNERIRELAGEDIWYNHFLMGFRLPLQPGDRTGTPIQHPYTDVYWKNSIPLAEIDFRK